MADAPDTTDGTAATVAPYGSWKSPVTSDLIVQGSVGLGLIALDGADTYWIEVRPGEGGRSVVVCRDEVGRTHDVTPAGFNARTRVHEYGGGDYTVAGGIVYFANFADQRLYRQRAAGDDAPQPLTPAGVDLRYADMMFDATRRRLVVVREDHAAGGEPVNTIVGINLDADAAGDGGTVLATGYDFFSSPRLSPDGRRLAWLCWNHPNMPWDGTELWVGELDADGAIVSRELIAGGRDESVFQPEWSPDEDGALYFVSDRTGWWNLYRARPEATATAANSRETGSGETDVAVGSGAWRIEALCPREAEFGLPQWVFGYSTYAFIGGGRIVCSYIERGVSQLALLDTATGELQSAGDDSTDILYLRAASNRAVFRSGTPARVAAIVARDLDTGAVEALRRSSDLHLDAGYLSAAQPIEFPTEDAQTAHALYYAPRNRDFRAPDGELPPLLVKSHGGPTSAAVTTLNLGIQYWTSRGFAVLDVNYGGSTGHGRAYRERLAGTWGVVDVDDCVNAARYLIERGLADPACCVIAGGSAGGYTTLSALTFRDLFKAGASHYGVSDLAALVRDTHKFESRYLDKLVGPYPERKDLYDARSPINFPERLDCPVIFFQGAEDKVVPPNQAELMVEALRRKGLPVAYVLFPGEQHGFRQAANIKRALDGELYFYARVFDFPLADPIEPVLIDNL